ncbi:MULTISPECIES: HIT domain-containing protein [Streptomyces]|uniref:HIT domain-containing protein n=2 Tax=Streptomyces TaxID=1883 RepID=A0ABU4LEQ7_9ACTN|nr:MULTISPECIES: HIT domain-containing protein [Streptomyces]MBZ3908442.1 HIT domain-containing protein [Streptomyces griseiscabiei]MDX2913960.1 HIT domain-containing protein [Streptomyces griseiscabiei]
MPDCDLCQAIDPSVDDCTLQRHLHAGQQRVMASNEHAAAVPTIGAFVPGYLLVVPTTHTLSLGQLSNEELEGVEDLARDLTDQLHRVYRRPTLSFEYGLNLPAARRIGHGHLHILPSTADLGGWLARRVPGYEIASYTQVPRGADTSYITVRDQTGTLTCFPVPNDAFPRIRLRKIVARLDPQIEDTAWDWEAHPFPELMRATVEDLTTVKPARPEAAYRAGAPR